ncbi:glycosyltransferase family 87 protein [soil metagenome]
MDVAPARARAVRILTAVASSPITVWAAFVLVHLWLGLVNLYAPSGPLGDVTVVYRFWMDQATQARFLVGIDSVWVYPVVALVPMLIATAFGGDQYGSTWLTMILVLDAVAFGFVTGWGRARERIGTAWWWVAFLLLLGPIALGRIDSVTVPVALVGAILIASRPKAAAVIITIAMWIKVWPAALVGAALIALRARWRILIVVLVVSGAVIGIALALGSGANVLSFVTQQTGRGLQVEAPVTTVWLWQALAGDPFTYVYWDGDILTYQVQGDGVEVVSALMTPLLLLVLLGIAGLGLRATRAGASAGDLFPSLSLALVAALIAVNKVGSPQFIAWLAVPIVLGLATSAAGHGGSFRFPAIIGLVVAALTQVVYPYLYNELLSLNPLMVSVLTVRNVLEFVLLGWAVLAVVRSPQQPGAEDHPDERWLPSVWPLADPSDSQERP